MRLAFMYSEQKNDQCDIIVMHQYYRYKRTVLSHAAAQVSRVQLLTFRIGHLPYL